MKLLRRRTADAAATPSPKGRWKVRAAKRLAVWLTPFALDVLLRRRRRRSPGDETPR